MKRVLSYILALSMILTLTACGGKSDSSETETTEKVLRAAINADPNSINPFDSLEGKGRSLWTPIFQQLFDYDEGVVPQPRLCESYELDEDGKGITIHLRKGVKFHNGEEMQANDVLFSLECGLNSGWASAYGKVDFENCKAIDDYTVYFAFEEVSGTLFYELAYCYIVNEENYKAFKDGTEDKLVGTGPYMWDEWQYGLEYSMARFEDYWGGNDQYYDKINVRVVTDASVAVLELEAGGLDMFVGPNASDAERVNNDPNSDYKLVMGSVITDMNLGFNLCADKVSDKTLREAIVAAINQEEILALAYAGIGYASTNVVPRGVSSHEDYNGSGQYTYDLELSKQKLAEAGYPDGVTLPLYYSNNTTEAKIAEVLIGQLAKVGITIESHATENATLNELLRSSDEAAMYLRTFNVSGEPNQIIALAWDPTVGGMGTNNYMRNANEPDAQMFTEIANQAKVQQDTDARNELYHQLFDIIIDNVWQYSLVDYGATFLMRKDIEGFWTGGTAYHYEDAYEA